MSLEKYNKVIYCKKCGVLLIEFQERWVIYEDHTKYWFEDGILETGEEDTVDSYPSEEHDPWCSICKEQTKYTTIIKADIFLQILKHCYRDSKSPAKAFKIELKPLPEDSKQMIAPTIQEIKEAITEELI